MTINNASIRSGFFKKREETKKSGLFKIEIHLQPFAVIYSGLQRCISRWSEQTFVAKINRPKAAPFRFFPIISEHIMVP